MYFFWVQQQQQIRHQFNRFYQSHINDHSQISSHQISKDNEKQSKKINVNKKNKKENETVSLDDKIEMIRRYDNGEKVSNIAPNYGISIHMVYYYIRTRETVLDKQKELTNEKKNNERKDDDANYLLSDQMGISARLRIRTNDDSNKLNDCNYIMKNNVDIDEIDEDVEREKNKHRGRPKKVTPTCDLNNKVNNEKEEEIIDKEILRQELKDLEKIYLRQFEMSRKFLEINSESKKETFELKEDLTKLFTSDYFEMIKEIYEYLRTVLIKESKS